MSVGFIRSNVVRKVVSVVCLLTFPAVAQQANTGLYAGDARREPATIGEPAADHASLRCEPASATRRRKAASRNQASHRCPKRRK